MMRHRVAVEDIVVERDIFEIIGLDPTERRAQRTVLAKRHRRLVARDEDRVAVDEVGEGGPLLGRERAGEVGLNLDAEGDEGKGLEDRRLGHIQHPLLSARYI
jgi:hypothetical protein